MNEIIDKILEIYRLKHEIADVVDTSEVCSTSTLSWHVFGYTNFIKVAKELNGGMFKEVDTGSGLYRWRYEFECRGVTVFCLSNDRREVPTDAEET